MSNTVQPRWKRRADEIADAIGDELSVTVLAPVEVGNDVRIHSDSITSFANSIAAVLPTAQEIAAAMWTYSSRTVGTDALKASDLNLDVTGKLRVVGEGHISVDVTHVDGNTIAGGAAVPVLTTGNNTVAITGQVSTNIGNVTVPISNPNNITVPVTNPNNLTVPVSVGSATVPVKASTSGIAQNIYGNTVLAPVDPNHTVTVPVSVGGVTVPLTNPNNVTVPVVNSNNVTVPVAVGGASVPVHVPSGTTVPASVSNTLSVPVSVGQAVVPVQNTANVSVPVAVGNANVPVATVSGTTQAADATGAAVTVPANWSSLGTLDVNVKEINSTALTSTTLDVNTTSAYKTGTITSASGGYQYGFTVTDDNGTVHSNSYVTLGQKLQFAYAGFEGKRVYYLGLQNGTNSKWQLTDDYVDALKGIVLAWNSNISGTHNDWIIQTDDGAVHDLQKIWDGPNAPRGSQDNHTVYRGRRVYKRPTGEKTTQVTTDTDWWGVADWILEPIEDEASIRYGFVHANLQNNAVHWAWYISVDNSQHGHLLIYRLWDDNNVPATSANHLKYLGARVANYKDSSGDWANFWQPVRDEP